MLGGLLPFPTLCWLHLANAFLDSNFSAEPVKWFGFIISGHLFSPVYLEDT